VLVYSILEVDKSSSIQKLSIFSLCIITCFFVSRVTENKKDLVRDCIEYYWHKSRRLFSPRPVEYTQKAVPLKEAAIVGAEDAVIGLGLSENKL
jgi:hypothetical protein